MFVMLSHTPRLRCRGSKVVKTIVGGCVYVHSAFEPIVRPESQSSSRAESAACGRKALVVRGENDGEKTRHAVSRGRNECTPAIGPYERMDTM